MYCRLIQSGPFTFYSTLNPTPQYRRERRLRPASATRTLGQISPWVEVKMLLFPVGVAVAEVVALIECLPQVHLWRPVAGKAPMVAVMMTTGTFQNTEVRPRPSCGSPGNNWPYLAIKM